MRQGSLLGAFNDDKEYITRFSKSHGYLIPKTILPKCINIENDNTVLRETINKIHCYGYLFKKYNTIPGKNSLHQYYQGELLGGEPHGNGILNRPHLQDLQVGTFNKGELIKGSILSDDALFFLVKKDKEYKSIGIIEYKNGNIYAGEIYKGTRSGEGKYT